MPYASNPAMPPLEPDEETIWRYMSFAKFVALLDSSTLHFARLDSFDDAFEGTLPKANLSHQLVEGLENTEHIKRQVVLVTEIARNELFANCWHSNHHESVPMWRMYGGSDSCVAIRSTIARYKSCFRNSAWNVYGSRVQYVDYDDTAVSNGNLLWLATHKRLIFSEEREIRGLVWKAEDKAPRVAFDSVGVSVDVDLQTLLMDVYVAPRSGSWFRRLMDSTLKRYNLPQVPAHVSKLDAQPLTLKSLSQTEIVGTRLGLGS